MRLTCLLALLSAALSAGAAQACCFFKCFKQGTTARPAAAAATRGAFYGDGVITPYMKITWVGGEKVDEGLGQVVAPVTHTPHVVFIVEVDSFTAKWCEPINVWVSDCSPLPIPATATAKAAPAIKRPRVEFKAKRLKAKPVAAPAPSGALPQPAPAPDGPWEYEFWVFELEPNCEYKAHAYSDRCATQSPTITFKTRALGSPPGPPGLAAPSPPKK